MRTKMKLKICKLEKKTEGGGTLYWEILRNKIEKKGPTNPELEEMNEEEQLRCMMEVVYEAAEEAILLR